MKTKGKCIAACLSMTFFLLASCSSTERPVKPVDDRIAAETDMIKKIIEADKPKTTVKVNSSSGITNGLVEKSTNSECIDNFNFLRDEGSDLYAKYAADYKKINDGFVFLNKKRNVMDKDAKEIYTMTLRMKMDKLCTKMQASVFNIVQGKLEKYSDI